MDITSRTARFVFTFCLLAISFTAVFSQKIADRYALKNVILTYKNGATRELLVNEVRLLKYGVFESSDKKIEVDTRNLNHVTIDTIRYIARKFSNPSWVIRESDLVLLQLIENGTIKFYSSALKFRDRDLFAEKDTVFRHLREYKKHIDQHHIVTVPEYRSTLQSMMLGCDSLPSGSLKDLDFRFDKIAAVIRQYNQTCGSGSSSIQRANTIATLTTKKNRQDEVKEYGIIDVLAGYTFGGATVYYNSSYWPTSFGSSAKITLNRPFAGIGVNLFSGHLPLRVRLKTQSTFEYVNSSVSNQYTQSSPRYDIAIHYKFALIRNQVGAGYALVIRKHSEINVGLAVGMNYIAMNESNFERVLTYTASFSPKSEVALDAREKFQLTSNATLGFNYKFFSLQYQLNLNKDYAFLGGGESDGHESRITLGWTILKRK